jgi:hypothetical protein
VWSRFWLRGSAEWLEGLLELAGQVVGGIPLVGWDDEFDVVAQVLPLRLMWLTWTRRPSLTAWYSNTTAPLWPA